MTFHVPSLAIQGDLFADFKSPTTTKNMLDPASYTGLAAFHKYWGKKPIESIAYLIENLTEEGDVVIDPFLGSGLVAVECLSRNRKFLGIDINPFSIEHTSFLLSLPRPQDYYDALRQIENEVAEEINNTYRVHDGRVASHYLWDDSQIASIWIKPESGRTRLEIEPTEDDFDTFLRYQPYEPETFRNLTFFTNSRINVKPTMSLHDVFTGRALMNIDKIIDAAKSFPPPLKRALLLTLTSASGQMSNMVFAIKNRLGDQFAELFTRLAEEPNKSSKILDSFIESKYKKQLSALDEKQLVSELYKLKSFDWGGDYQNSLDKYLVSRYVKAIQSYDTLISKFDNEIRAAVQGYVLNSWYNHWSSILIEHIFKSHNTVLPTVGQIKHVDFFINNVPFDLKVTYLPAEFVKARRKVLGLLVELTYLKQQARSIGINFDNDASPSDVYYEITEKLKDNGSKAALSVLDKVRNETMTILSEVREEPKSLARWLYENQGEMRFGSENRLFLVLLDTNDFSGSWKLKRNLDLLKPAIQKYLNDFTKKNVSDLKVNFNYKGKPQVFTALTDVLFVVK